MDPIVEATGATAAVIAEFRSGLRARAAMAAVAQEKLNALAKQPTRMMEGVGQLVARVDPDVYWLMRLRHGDDCWQDPDFRKRAVQNGLIAPVRAQQDKVRVGFGMASAGR